MKKDDIVDVVTNCKNCGTLSAKILDINDFMAIVEITDELHDGIDSKIKALPLKYLRSKEHV